MTSRSWKRLLPNYIILTLFLLIILIPILGLVFSAFKTDSEVIKGPLSFPSEIRLDAFKEAWTTGRFNYFFRNSVIVTIVVVAVSVFFATLTVTICQASVRDESFCIRHALVYMFRLSCDHSSLSFDESHESDGYLLGTHPGRKWV
jgi:ABC-type spermidine/putrescine transport system permease subunit II